MIKFETKKLIIRNHIESDWKDLYEYLSLPVTYEFEPGEPVSLEESKLIMAERCKGDDFLAVVHKNNGHMIGHLYFHHSDPEHFMTWELGYIFNPKFQNKGYCTEASSAIVRYAFKEFKAHKVVAHCNPKNTPSWRVLEKIGMEREGFFKQKAFFKKDKNGNPIWHDCYSYGLLNNLS
ncbi:MAG: GNAT family N-acetyltransferase [Spirochaetales bacterium]|nr:GNAT family N-acetyltransferase [Spirochaetales bacterium]